MTMHVHSTCNAQRCTCNARLFLSVCRAFKPYPPAEFPTTACGYWG